MFVVVAVVAVVTVVAAVVVGTRRVLARPSVFGQICLRHVLGGNCGPCLVFGMALAPSRLLALKILIWHRNF